MNAQPRTQKIRVVLPAVAAGSDGTVVIGKADFAGKLSSMKFTPAATITGANTNTRKHELINKGQSGVGAVLMASYQYDSGNNATGFDDKTYTNSPTAANLVVAAGDVLAAVSTHLGTGLADPGGLLEITITNNTD
jgi:hypothetical protein